MSYPFVDWGMLWKDRASPHFPKCSESIAWVTSKRNGQENDPRSRAGAIRRRLSFEQWQDALNSIRSLDEQEKQYLLAPVHGPSLAGLARNLDAVEKHVLLLALFDPAALRQAATGTFVRRGSCCWL